MKTLLFILEYPPFKGGVANYYGHVVKYWPEPENILVLDNNDNALIKNWLWPKWLFAIWHLWHTIKIQKIEHILIGHILPLGTVAYYVTKLTKTPYSVFLHGMDFTYALRQTRKKQMARRILIKAGHIICANSYTAGLVKEFVGKDYESRVVVVNPGVDPLTTHLPVQAGNSQLTTQTNNLNNSDKQKVTILKEKYNLQNKVVLLTVGRLVKRKGIDKVLESLPNVFKKVPSLIYVILGNGLEITNYKLLITNLDLSKKVILITDADDNEKNKWYRICDIFIMPARVIRRGTTNAAHANNKMEGDDFEGFGIVYLEANLAGKPVIAGDSGGVGDAVQDMVSGLLVNPENTAEISKAIIKLATDANLRKKLGEQGRRRALTEFRWEDKVKMIYNRITHLPA